MTKSEQRKFDRLTHENELLQAEVRKSFAINANLLCELVQVKGLVRDMREIMREIDEIN